MFRNSTTVIIGAGASAEFGLPVGWELAKKIKNRSQCNRNRSGVLQPRNQFLIELLTNHFEPDTLQEVYRNLDVISEGIGTAVSIDAFIDRFRGNNMIATLGKLLIAIEIADAERGCIMHPDQLMMNDLTEKQSADDTWIGSFVRILFDGVSDPAEIGRDLTIICFNYDRCIEFYLADAISSAYDIPYADGQEIVSKLNIIHPYGTLGRLPSELTAEGPGILSFGERLENTVDWIGIAQNNIRTYTEQQHEPDMLRRMHNAIEDAGTLIFLGFGFNNQNLNILRVGTGRRNGELPPKNIYSSGVGLSRQIDETITRRIMHLLWDNPLRHKQNKHRLHVEYDQTCSELFKTHNMNFSSFTRSYFREQDGAYELVSLSASSKTDD